MTPQYRPYFRISQTVAGRAAGTPRLTFWSVPLPQQVSIGGYTLLRCRVAGGSSTQAPDEPSFDCVYGPGPV